MTHHSIIGLPRSGKTTFLAALWHLINSGEISSQLVLDKLVGDVQHLNSIVEAWRRCEEVPRTSMAAETTVAIHVHEPATERRTVLAFPDLSGESFKAQVASRTCDPAYVSSFEEEGGILLFLNADRPLDGITILDVAPVVEGTDEPQEAKPLQPWSAELIPEQVKIVELLQFLQRRPFQRRRRRVALMVSAWDVVQEPRPDPAKWLEREFPLLHQFLVTNSNSFESRVYGVSAQGGDVTGVQKPALLRKTPTERIQCIGPGVAQHDLTSPVVWLMAEA